MLLTSITTRVILIKESPNNSSNLVHTSLHSNPTRSFTQLRLRSWILLLSRTSNSPQSQLSQISVRPSAIPSTRRTHVSGLSFSCRCSEMKNRSRCVHEPRYPGDQGPVAVQSFPFRCFFPFLSDTVLQNRRLRCRAQLLNDSHRPEKTEKNQPGEREREREEKGKKMERTVLYNQRSPVSVVLPRRSIAVACRLSEDRACAVTPAEMFAL